MTTRQRRDTLAERIRRLEERVAALGLQNRRALTGRIQNSFDRPRIIIVAGTGKTTADDQLTIFAEMVTFARSGALLWKVDEQAATSGEFQLLPAADGTWTGQRPVVAGRAAVDGGGSLFLLARNRDGSAGQMQVFAGDIFLVAGAQANGYCGVRETTTSAGDRVSNGVTYGGVSRLVNTPSSITLFLAPGTSDVNRDTDATTRITDRGFTYSATSVNAGEVAASRHYVTVGN